MDNGRKMQGTNKEEVRNRYGKGMGEVRNKLFVYASTAAHVCDVCCVLMLSQLVLHPNIVYLHVTSSVGAQRVCTRNERNLCCGTTGLCDASFWL